MPFGITGTWIVIYRVFENKERERYRNSWSNRDPSQIRFGWKHARPSPDHGIYPEPPVSTICSSMIPTTYNPLKWIPRIFSVRIAVMNREDEKRNNPGVLRCSVTSNLTPERIQVGRGLLSALMPGSVKSFYWLQIALLCEQICTQQKQFIFM